MLSKIDVALLIGVTTIISNIGTYFLTYFLTKKKTTVDIRKTEIESLSKVVDMYRLAVEDLRKEVDRLKEIIEEQKKQKGC